MGQSLLVYGEFTMGEDSAAGRALIERARAAFGEIGADGWLREADAALATGS